MIWVIRSLSFVLTGVANFDAQTTATATKQDAIALAIQCTTDSIIAKLYRRFMSLEEAQEPAQLTRKRTYDIAFAQSSALIQSLLPQVPSALAQAAQYCQDLLRGVSQYLVNQLHVWQEEPSTAAATVRQRKKRRKYESAEEREIRRAHKKDHRRPAIRADAFTTINDVGPDKAGVSDTMASRLVDPRTNILNRSQTKYSLRRRFSEALASRERLQIAAGPVIPSFQLAGVPSPLHRDVLSHSTGLRNRSQREVQNVLNRITPHKARISKPSKTEGKSDQQSLPFTEGLAHFLESPAQNSPFVNYRSPGAPLPSPSENYNPFKTKSSSNRLTSDQDSQSLEDLINQLRREHPHQYEWKRIDAERAQRNKEIAKKRAATLRVNRPPLPIESSKVVEKAWFGHLPMDHILVVHFNQELRVRDLLTLYSTNWLNDEVINFYLSLIVERSKFDNLLPKVHAFNTFFYTKLRSGGYSTVRRWAKKAKVEIASCDLVLVPVHLGV